MAGLTAAAVEAHAQAGLLVQVVGERNAGIIARRARIARGMSRRDSARVAGGFFAVLARWVASSAAVRLATLAGA
jgi:hypothetical protein